MNTSERTVELLEEVVALLRLLTLPTRKEAAEQFAKDVLTTDERQNMWAALDGKKDASQLAAIANVSVRAAQIFIKELDERGFVTVTRTGRSKLATRNVTAVLAAYAEDVRHGL